MHPQRKLYDLTRPCADCGKEAKASVIATDAQIMRLLDRMEVAVCAPCGKSRAEKLVAECMIAADLEEAEGRRAVVTPSDPADAPKAAHLEALLNRDGKFPKVDAEAL
jgi:hypothetical protein